MRLRHSYCTGRLPACLCFVSLLAGVLIALAVSVWSDKILPLNWSTDLTIHTNQYGSSLYQQSSDAANSNADETLVSHMSTERYMIYYCSWFCGGWTDRLKGIVIAYVIATLTNRRFGIQIVDNPCALTDFVLPNEVNWSIPENVDLKSGAQVYSLLSSAVFYRRVSKSNFDDLFTSRVVLFKANLEYFDQIKLNKLYRKQLEWMMPLSRDQIFSIIYRKLFTFSPRVQAEINRTLRLARPAKRGKLICAHVRFANNSELVHEWIGRHTKAHGETVLTFLRTFDPSSPTYNKASAMNASKEASRSKDGPVRFFVTSDSAIYNDRAARVFGERFVRTEGRFVHVDKPGKNRRAACDGFTKVLVDQYLLTTCDVLVVSFSGFSRHAAYLRGTDRGLYCLLRDGTLRKCSASRLKELYHILG